MKARIGIFVLLTMLTAMATTTAWAYDKAMAENYKQYFAPFSGKATGKSMQMIKSPDFVKAVQAGEDMFVMDVRTPGETGIYSLSVPGSVAIPMDEVFMPENLARIPTDKKVVVVCKAGHRAVAIGTALRHIGFSNVYVLKNGSADLAQYLNPKTAY